MPPFLTRLFHAHAVRHRLENADADTLTAVGFGVRVSLKGNRLKISKGGIVGLLGALLGFEGSFSERTLRIDQISAIEVDKPILFFRYIRVSYPGSPQMTGNDLRDVMAENAIIMSFFDNRAFYRIIKRVEKMMEHGTHAGREIA